MAQELAPALAAQVLEGLGPMLEQRDRRAQELEQQAQELAEQRDSAMALAEQVDQELQTMREQLREIAEHNGRGLQRLGELAAGASRAVVPIVAAAIALA